MARNRASMREGPLADLFRATEAAQRQAQQEAEQQEGQQGEQPAAAEQPPQSAPPPTAPAEEPQEMTVEHVPDFAVEEPAEP